MELSAGIIFVNNGELFIAHATETKYWDIPKGGVDANESHREAAIRECREETGFVVSPSDLVSLGVFDYSVKKKLALFLYTGYDYPKAEEGYCVSTFVSYGRTLPEMDDYRYIPLSEMHEYLRPNMARVLGDLLFFSGLNHDKTA